MHSHWFEYCKYLRTLSVMLRFLLSSRIAGILGLSSPDKYCENELSLKVSVCRQTRRVQKIAVASRFITLRIKERKDFNVVVAQIQGVDACLVNTALFTILSYWVNWRQKGGVGQATQESEMCQV